MNSNEPPTKKYKKPKHNTQLTTNPHLNRRRQPSDESPQGSSSPPLCPLLAKDSEWVDMLHSSPQETSRPPAQNQAEEVLQLVECEDDPGMKPLAIMFPGLIEKDPATLEGVLTKGMSTTEVTRHLVDLKQKANFASMKKSIRLIPREKSPERLKSHIHSKLRTLASHPYVRMAGQAKLIKYAVSKSLIEIWLESLTENANSVGSLQSPFSSQSSEYEADVDTTEDESNGFQYRTKRKTTIPKTQANPPASDLTQCIETSDLEESVASEV